MNQNTYLTPEQAAARLHFSTRHFRNIVMKRDLVEGVHFIRAFDRRKYLVIWERVEEELLRDHPMASTIDAGIPMSKGGRCYA